MKKIVVFYRKKFAIGILEFGKRVNEGQERVNISY